MTKTIPLRLFEDKLKYRYEIHNEFTLATGFPPIRMHGTIKQWRWSDIIDVILFNFNIPIELRIIILSFLPLKIGDQVKRFKKLINEILKKDAAFLNFTTYFFVYENRKPWASKSRMFFSGENKDDIRWITLEDLKKYKYVLQDIKR